MSARAPFHALENLVRLLALITLKIIDDLAPSPSRFTDQTL
jgi:hypothetical protein